MVNVYVRASRPPSLDQARDLAALLQARLRQRRLDVAIRTDSFFILDTTFPVVYRFDPFRRPPTEREYNEGPEVYCGPRALRFPAVGDLRCSSTERPRPAEVY